MYSLSHYLKKRGIVLLEIAKLTTQQFIMKNVLFPTAFNLDSGSSIQRLTRCRAVRLINLVVPPKPRARLEPETRNPAKPGLRSDPRPCAHGPPSPTKEPGIFKTRHEPAPGGDAGGAAAAALRPEGIPTPSRSTVGAGPPERCLRPPPP